MAASGHYLHILVVALANILKFLQQAMVRLDQQIEQAMNQHPHASIFRKPSSRRPSLVPDDHQRPRAAPFGRWPAGHAPAPQKLVV